MRHETCVFRLDIGHEQIRLRAQDIRPESRTQVAEMTVVFATDASKHRCISCRGVHDGRTKRLSRNCVGGALRRRFSENDSCVGPTPRSIQGKKPKKTPGWHFRHVDQCGLSSLAPALRSLRWGRPTQVSDSGSRHRSQSPQRASNTHLLPQVGYSCVRKRICS